jgi:hypothetical protein
MEITPTTINCDRGCVDTCAHPTDCPQQEFVSSASQFMSETSLDKMHEIAEAARMKKMMAPPQWVIPEWPE